MLLVHSLIYGTLPYLAGLAAVALCRTSKASLLKSSLHPKVTLSVYEVYLHPWGAAPRILNDAKKMV